MSAMSDSLDELDTPGSLSEKAAIFREGKGNVSVLGSGPALIPLRSPFQPPGALHNRTTAAAATLFRGNRKCREGEEMQMSLVPNAFPDLFSSECLLPWTKNSATQVTDCYIMLNISDIHEQASGSHAHSVRLLGLPKKVVM
ncbi:hypothetical protein SRHO_G00107910 [Serrasalmus rhombeus]